MIDMLVKIALSYKQVCIREICSLEYGYLYILLKSSMPFV